MALGFSPSQSIEIPLNDLTPEQFIMLAADTASKIGWGIYFINATGLTATTSEEFFVPRDQVILHISDNIAHIKTRPAGARMPDRTTPKSEFPTQPPRRNKNALQDFAATLKQSRTTYSPEQLTAAFERARPQLAPPHQDVSGQTKKPNIWLSFFLPRKDYFITPLIIDINILIFVAMVLTGASFFSPDTMTLIRWGANYTGDIQQGQWWRLLTCCFLHIGFFHLLMNMYAFWYIGLLLEPYLGRWKFTLAYLLTGIAASAASLYWHNLVVSAGASGAIFGMYGVFLAMLTTNLIHPEKRKPLLRSIGLFVVYNLLFGVIGTIDNAAHIGGLISGLLIGYILYPILKKNPLHQEGI